jgi:hypothetical protein
MHILANLLLASLLASSGSSSGPTLAVEDTMHTSVPEVLVRAPRVTLDEILERVARGEARRESLITDQSFLAGIRVLREVTNTKKEPRLVEETVWRVYKKRPDKVRSLLLRRREPKPPKAGAKADVDVDFSPGMGEEIVNFAFRADARDTYRYHIVGRDLVANHLIYRIQFEPRSALDPFAPSGLVWVDTNDFVIVREEVRFERSPVPLVMKSIDRMVVERVQAQGHWVLSRVLMRAELTVSIPTFGRSFDVAMHFSDYKINAGLNDAFFPASR